MQAQLLPASDDIGSGVETGLSTNCYRGVLHAVGESLKCICCPLLPCMCGPIVTVEQGWAGVMTRFGKYDRLLAPGLYVYNFMSQNVRRVCMKMQSLEIPRQAAMTRDNLTVKVDAVCFVTVVDPVRATFHVDDYHHAVKTLAASTLLRTIAENDLSQIFAERATVNARLTQVMQEKTSGWGLSVSSVEMRDITIPETMQRAMAQIAEANREAQAKVIVAEGQRKAAHIFAQAAEAMEKQPMSIQLQWFETLRQIAAEKNSTIVVPDSILGTVRNFCSAPGATASAGLGAANGGSSSTSGFNLIES